MYICIFSIYTYDIVVGVLHGSQCQHSDQGNRCRHRSQRGYRRYQLEHQQAQEIEIRQSLELLQQIERQKRQQGILRCLDVVVLCAEKKTLLHIAQLRFTEEITSLTYIVDGLS